MVALQLTDLQVVLLKSTRRQLKEKPPNVTFMFFTLLPVTPF